MANTFLSEEDFKNTRKTSEAFFNDKLSLSIAFRENRENFAVNISEVSEIATLTDIFTVPGTPDIVLGLIDLRGRIVTIFDLFKKGITSTSALIFSPPCHNLGISITGHIDSVSIDFGKVEKINESDPDATHSEFISGTVRMSGKNYNLLSINKIRDYCRYTMLSIYRKQTGYNGGINGS